MASLPNASGFVQVDWVFEPAYLLEQTRTAQRGPLWLEVKHDGTATARLDGYATTDGIQERVRAAHSALEDVLFGAQLTDLLPVSIRLIGLTGHRPDGSIETIGLVNSLSCDTKIGRPDTVTGDVVTRQARLDRKRQSSEALLRHRALDSTLQRMCESFNAALKDPADELVHLYEVCEAFTKRGLSAVAPDLFKEQQSAKDRLHRLCNNKALLQGRHRGQSVGSGQRSATEAELKTAREDAAGLIEAYALWLDELSLSTNTGGDAWEFDQLPGHSRRESLIVSNEHHSRDRFGTLLEGLADEELKKRQARERLHEQFANLGEVVITPALRGAVEALKAQGYDAAVTSTRAKDGRPMIRFDFHSMGANNASRKSTLVFAPSLHGPMMTVAGTTAGHSEGETECVAELIDCTFVQQKAFELVKRALRAR